jgi:hypothetical protein
LKSYFLDFIRERYIFEKGENNRLAILLTDDNSNWIGLTQGLKNIGIPFCLTKDFKKAKKHQIIMVYPSLDENYDDNDSLKKFVAKGGTLICFQPSCMSDLFGYEISGKSEDHFEITFLSFPNQEKTQTCILSDVLPASNRLKVVAFSKISGESLAQYGNNKSAIISNNFGKGKSFAIGLDLGEILTKSFKGIQPELKIINSGQVNFGGDPFLHFIKNIYRHYEPNAVTAEISPFNKSLTVAITHDLDCLSSIENAVEYANYENSQNIKTTYFILTKYIRDYIDFDFYESKTIPVVKELKKIGMEIASHSVCHSYVFDDFIMGTGEEQYPSYQPYVVNLHTTIGGSILGELRVSKYLLEDLSENVISFRAGYLSFPKLLPQALSSCGFSFDSSFSIERSWTYLPFQLFNSKDDNFLTNIVEIPITFQDHLTPRLSKRLEEAIKLAEKISINGGLFVLLIHPTIFGEKFRFEKKFIKAVRHYSWFDSISEIGHFWLARSKIQLDVIDNFSKKTLLIHSEESIKGLTIQIPKRWKLEENFDKNNLEIVQINDKIVIGEIKKSLKAPISIYFDVLD